MPHQSLRWLLYPAETLNDSFFRQFGPHLIMHHPQETKVVDTQ